MLVSIGMTPPTTKMTRRRWRQGAESDGHSHNKGHRCQQQRNSNYDETPTTKTSTKMLVYQQRKRLRESDGYNVNN